MSEGSGASPEKAIKPAPVLGGFQKGEGRKEIGPRLSWKRMQRRKGGEDVENDPDVEDREKALESSPDLDPNIRLPIVEEFQRLVRTSRALRMAMKESGSLDDRKKAILGLAQTQKTIDALLEAGGPAFEKAYREYMKSRSKYFGFKRDQKELQGLEKLLLEPTFASIPSDAKINPRAHAYLAELFSSSNLDSTNAEDRAVMDALKTVFPEDSQEYRSALAEMFEEEEMKIPQTKKEVSAKVKAMRKKVEKEWDDPMVRYFAGHAELAQFLKDLDAGKDVLETQSAIDMLNKLDEWESLHQRTTIGGVLVGPPGVGKTTVVKHYLEAKGRKYIYMDLSEDVTRYMLYGSKSMEFKTASEFHAKMVGDLQGLDEKNFRAFVLEHGKTIGEVLHLSKEEATIVLLRQVEDALAEVASDKSKDGELDEQQQGKVSKLRAKIQELGQKGFRRELAGEFSHLVKKNGWRDGVIISALRKGQSVLCDEFNKNKNWSLLYGLMTAKPGEDWCFSDNNNETIHIPEDWRMYFTANIGKRHGGFKVAEALASRAEEEVMEVEYPEAREEMKVALALLANPAGDFLRPKDDLAKLFILINEGFPAIRNFTKDKAEAVPISYRTIRGLAEKLVVARDARTKKPVYQKTDKTFDEAVYEVLVANYALYEDKAVPRAIVGQLTSIGLLFDDKLKKQVIAWIGEETYQERKDAHAKRQEDYEAIIKKIQGLSSFSMSEMSTVPSIKKF